MPHDSAIATNPASSLGLAARRTLWAPVVLMLCFGTVLAALLGWLRSETLDLTSAERAVGAEREAYQLLLDDGRFMRAYLRTGDLGLLAPTPNSTLANVTERLERAGGRMPTAAVAARELRTFSEQLTAYDRALVSGRPSGAEEPSGETAKAISNGAGLMARIHAEIPARLGYLERERDAREARAAACTVLILSGGLALAVAAGIGIALYARNQLLTISRAYAQALEDLARARDDAETANRLKDEFLATLGHELRTPLNAILGWTTLLRRRPDDPDTVRRATDTIDRNARSQARMVDEMVDLARVVSGQLVLDVKAVDLEEMVRCVVGAAAAASQAKRVVVTAKVEPGSKAWGDPARIQQMVWSLLGNAVKFTPPQGKVDLTVGRSGGQIEVRVADSGPGIRSEFLPVLFQSFRQENASTTRTYGGLGLGLSVVRHLVEMHGGTVRAESPGEAGGATFILTLPEPPRTEAATAAPPESPPDGGREGLGPRVREGHPVDAARPSRVWAT